MRHKRVLLKRTRKNAGLTQEEMAYRLGVDRSTVARWEAGQTEPSAWLRTKLAKLLGVTRAELSTLLEPTVEPPARPEFHGGPDHDEQECLATALRGSPSVVDQAIVTSVLGPSRTLAVLDEFTQMVIPRYELEGPHRLAPETRMLLRLCHQLSSQVSSTDERLMLAKVSARQSALLAYMSVNLSQFAEADRYALQAAMLAMAVRDRPLQAWVKGTQSFSAYYQKRYDEALNLARVGLRFARGDSQRIRLLSNGVARAAGKLGDRTTVDQAVNGAFELIEAQDGPAGMTPCIDFAPYGQARATANAATAYLSVGDYVRAQDLTRELSSVVATSDSDWSRSLVHLDEASALTLGRGADIEHAAVLGLQALAGSASKPIASIGSRAAELAADLRRRGKQRAGQEFAASLHEWNERTRGMRG